jgi:hypothetical protein
MADSVIPRTSGRIQQPATHGAAHVVESDEALCRVQPRDLFGLDRSINTTQDRLFHGVQAPGHMATKDLLSIMIGTHATRLLPAQHQLNEDYVAPTGRTTRTSGFHRQLI